LEVTVRYFAAHKEIVGAAEERVTVPDGTTVAALMEELFRLHPLLRELHRDTVVSVNRGVGTDDIMLREGDDVALFPPISGG
jgi:molybdopterin converting factor subunit 1